MYFKVMSHPITLAVLVALLAGAMVACAQLAGVVDRASDSAAEAVTSYCENLSADQRATFGDQVRSKAAPHSIAVTCN